LAVNYKLDTAQTFVDDYRNVSSALNTLIEEHSIDQADVREITVTPVGTSFLILIAWKSIEALIRTYTFAAVKVGLVSVGISKALAFTRPLSPLIGLKVSTIIRRVKLRQKPAAVLMGLKFVKFLKTFSKKPLVNSIGIKYLSLVIGFISQRKNTVLVGIKPKMFEALWNGMPVQEE